MVGDAREQVELLRDLRRRVGAAASSSCSTSPRSHAPSGEITGAEALMRWHHPQRGMVSPAVFIPIAERFGLIGALGHWVIDEACRQARAWRDEGLRMRVAINLSVHQLRQPDLAERIAAALQRHQRQPAAADLRDHRVGGDGGRRGHACASSSGSPRSACTCRSTTSAPATRASRYLRQLPAEELKIDRSFVLDLETSADARAVVDAVVKLAQALGLKVVAEGVETEAQHADPARAGLRRAAGLPVRQADVGRGAGAVGDERRRAARARVPRLAVPARRSPASQFTERGRAAGFLQSPA